MTDSRAVSISVASLKPPKRISTTVLELFELSSFRTAQIVDRRCKIPSRIILTR